MTLWYIRFYYIDLQRFLRVLKETERSLRFLCSRKEGRNKKQNIQLRPKMVNQVKIRRVIQYLIDIFEIYGYFSPSFRMATKKEETYNFAFLVL